MVVIETFYLDKLPFYKDCFCLHQMQTFTIKDVQLFCGYLIYYHYTKHLGFQH